MRLTVDEGAPRAPHGQEWDDGESVAWNDGIDLDDPARYPAIKYASVDKYARVLAVLAAAARRRRELGGGWQGEPAAAAGRHVRSRKRLQEF